MTISSTWSTYPIWRPESVSKLEVEFHGTLFDDETRFQTGENYRRNSDPSSPQKWIKIND